MLKLGRRAFASTDHLVMAIVNRTPDSFFDRGATYAAEAALERVHQVVVEGADIVDIGGVKAAPGDEVDVAEELRRVAPFVASVREAYPDLVISVDTWRHEVGREVRAGGVPPRTRPHRIGYDDVVADVLAGTVALAERAVALGVDRERVLIDPGHDFGKNTWQSLEITRRLDELVATGWPVLVSVSNKDFVGESLDLPVTDRLNGTLAALAVCAWHGSAVYRVHAVREARQVLDMVATIRGDRLPARMVRGLA